jgi:Ala-tRNA(Pro) deacylase
MEDAAMPIASTISDFLIDRNIDYHVFPHDYTESSKESARAAHIEPSRVAKAVVLATHVGTSRVYRVAVLPASRDINVDLLSELTRETMELAKEYELTVLFPDCAVGAVPALGSAYGLQTIVDEAIKDHWEDVFFEAGDHEELIRVSSDQFRRLMADARCAAFSYSPINTIRKH